MDQRERRPRTLAELPHTGACFSSETQETSVHSQSFESKRPSCRDANWSVNTTRWTLFKKKNKINRAAGLTPKCSCHCCSYNQRSTTETSCASHNFRFWVTITQLLERFIKQGGQQNKNQTKTKMRLWTVQSQWQFPHPQTAVQEVLRQLVAVSVFLFFQAFCLKKKCRCSCLTYITSSAPQCGPGNSM